MFETSGEPNSQRDEESKSLRSRRLCWVVLFLLLLLSAGGAQAEGNTYPARCRATTQLNVRSGPKVSYSKLGLLQRNEYITVLYITGSSGDPWGAIEYGSRRGYVSMRYVSYVSALPAQSATQPTKASSSGGGVAKFFAGVWKCIKWVLTIIAVVLVLALWQQILELAVYAGFFAGAGAILFAIFGGSAGTGAIVGLVVAALMGLRLLVNQLELDVDGSTILRGVFIIAYYVISFPFYWLNQLEHFLIEPWRYLFRTDWVRDEHKPTLRTVLEVLSVIMYIAITPLRLFNAVVYNILIHCVTGIYDLFFEVLSPSDTAEGAGHFGRWLLLFPWRLLKYPVWHGLLTVIESVLWTVVDIFIPARTLYHGTDLTACQSITGDPHRNSYRRNTSVWSTGTFLASSSPNCSWAGRGVYFAINRSLAMGYSRGAASPDNAPVMIACRVSMGRVVNYTLAPSRVYQQAGGGGNHDELNKFGDRHGYTTGQWYNNRHHWEYCLFDWQNRYNHPWRIRPVYILNMYTGRAQHISGGVQHWLFDRAVLEDLGLK